MKDSLSHLNLAVFLFMLLVAVSFFVFPSFVSAQVGEVGEVGEAVDDSDLPSIGLVKGLDEFHGKYSQKLVGAGEKLDSFFGSERVMEESRGSRLQLGGGAIIDEDGEVTYTQREK